MTTSYQAGECSCKVCRDACAHKPGWFRPEQIEPLAKALGMTTQELFDNHLQIDWWVGAGDGDSNIFILSPRIDSEGGGTMMEYDSRGKCHWFEDGKCAIHDKGKPAECQQMRHEDDEDITKHHHKAAALSWRAKKHQDMIRTLYGDEPVAEEGGIGDWLALLVSG